MTRIKKKDLRKGLPQLPINFPAPDVIPFRYEQEKDKVERLAKRLADNEAEVRDSVLAELPRYIKEVCVTYEAAIAGVIEDLGAKRETMVEVAPKAQGSLVLWEPLYDALDDDKNVQQLTLVFDKLCLGIFFCFWHSDKPLTQHECAHQISLLIRSAPTRLLRSVFLRSLLRRLSQSWTTIDKWRMDKYMSLVRKIVHQCIVLCIEEEAVGKKKAAGSASEKKAQSPAAKRRRTSDSGDAAEDEIAPSTFSLADSFAADFCSIVQKEVVLSSAVGLTMHTCDLFLVELLRPPTMSVDLFTFLAKGIPFFAMSRGDFVEKRVMDHFVVPVSSGSVEASRLQKGDGDDVAKAYSVQIATELQKLTHELSVSRQTKFSVRPLMTEAEQMIDQYVERVLFPERFVRATGHDRHKQLVKEVADAEANYQEAVFEHATKRKAAKAANKKRSGKAPKRSRE